MSAAAIGLSDNVQRRRCTLEDGAPLDYFVCGEAGPALVCVNALGQDLLVFSKLVDRFAGQRRVLAWKLRGTFDASGPLPTLRDHVADLGRVLANEGLTEC